MRIFPKRNYYEAYGWAKGWHRSQVLLGFFGVLGRGFKDWVFSVEGVATSWVLAGAKHTGYCQGM